MSNSALRVTRTLLFTQRSLEATLDITPSYDSDFTINTKHGVAASETIPAGSRPRIRYFGVGTNGFRNVSTNSSEPHEVRPENLDLYEPIPIRMRTADQDLTASERANYRMRVESTINGEAYVSYYLKVLTLESAAVAFTLGGSTTAYELDAANLRPSPPTQSQQGAIQGRGSQIEASASARSLLTGEEIAEAVAILHGGDVSKARISEFGLYMGHDATIVATDAANQSFNYTEAIQCELASHRTWNGTDLSSSASELSQVERFSTESLGIA